MFARIERLVLTFIAKKYIAWLVAIWFLLDDKITSSDWCLLTGGIFAIDAYSKANLPLSAEAKLKSIESQGD